MMNTFPVLKDNTYQTIISRIKGMDKIIIVMTYLTERDYRNIKQGEDILVKRGNREFLIQQDNIYCFGEIDFNNNSEDMEELDTFNFFDHLMAKGPCIPADYDYINHCCYSPINRPKYYETFKVSKYLQYKHGILCKPKYTILFNVTL